MTKQWSITLLGNLLSAGLSCASISMAAGETGIELNYPVYPAFSWE